MAVPPETYWRDVWVMRGATTDRRIYRLAQRYLRDVRSGRWEAGRRLQIPKRESPPRPGQGAG